MNELNNKTMNTTAATIENAQPAAWPVTYETVSYTHLTLPTNREV